MPSSFSRTYPCISFQLMHVLIVCAKCLKADYMKFFELVIIFLGEFLSRELKFKTLGATHQVTGWLKLFAVSK